jgi:hypothetical protein
MAEKIKPKGFFNGGKMKVVQQNKLMLHKF